MKAIMKKVFLCRFTSVIGGVAEMQDANLCMKSPQVFVGHPPSGQIGSKTWMELTKIISERVDKHLAFLQRPDAIMENPTLLAEAISHVRKNYPDGNELVKNSLITGYRGAMEILIELGTALTYTTNEVLSTRVVIESVVQDAILQSYDRSKAISCLDDDVPGRVTETMEWLSQVVEWPKWRETFYQLALQSRNEDCPFLSLAMPCIAFKDSLISELTCVPLAWNTLEILLKCVAHLLQPLLADGEQLSDVTPYHSVAFLQPKRLSSSTSGSGASDNNGGSSSSSSGHHLPVDSTSSSKQEQLTLPTLDIIEQLFCPTTGNNNDDDLSDDEDGLQCARLTPATTSTDESPSTATGNIGGSGSRGGGTRRVNRRGRGKSLQSQKLSKGDTESSGGTEESCCILAGGGGSGQQSAVTTRQLLNRFLEMGCHSEHSYLIIQAVLQCLAAQSEGYTARHLSWLLESEATRRGRDVSRFSVYMCGARDYPDAMNAMRLILRDQELRPSSVIKLYELYQQENSPPVALLRQPIFVVLLADALFTSRDRLLVDEQERYAYLYTYGAMVIEDVDPETDRRRSIDRERINPTKEQVLQAGQICRQWINTASTGMTLRSFRDLPTLLESLVRPPISFGVFRFVRMLMLQRRHDFEVNLDTLKPYCILVNELAETNKHLHSALLAFITELLASSVEDMEDLSQLEYKRMIVGLLVHLIVCGYVLPTIRIVRRLFRRNLVDVSLVRFFVTEVLKIASPPYAPSFANAFHPLVSHPEIADGLKDGIEREHHAEFLRHYRDMKAC